MARSSFGAVLAVSLVGGLFPGRIAAHPASGIVVTAKGEVYFIHTGTGVAKIDTAGKLTYVHKVKGGGHFLALDAEAKFATQLPRLFERITPAGEKPAVLYASGGAPFVVNRDGNLYYGSGFPDGPDTTPGGLTLTRLATDGKQTLFAPELKSALAKMNEAVTGLAMGRDGSMYVACPNAIVKVKPDGTFATLLHPVEVKDGDDVFAKVRQQAGYTDSVFFHAPYLRGLDVAPDETIYAAVTGRRCVIKVAKDRTVETVLKSAAPWTPTGVAVHGKDLFVLEYAHHDKAEGWRPRVRKLAADGKVVTLAEPGRDEKEPERE